VPPPKATIRKPRTKFLELDDFFFTCAQNAED